MIKFLFGKAGSGKNHVGLLASRAHGLHFHDADMDLPERFKKAIERREKVTEDVREEYVDVMIATIRRLSLAYRDICICQALPRNKYRQRILDAIPSVEFVWVDVPDDLLVARLGNRIGHFASLGYAEMVNKIFETPTIPHERIENGADPEAVSAQIGAVFGSRSFRDAAPYHRTITSAMALHAT